MRIPLLLSAVAATALLAAQMATSATPALPLKLSKNLVVNPGAEAGPATPDTAQQPLPVPGWTVTNGLFAAAYNAFRWAPDPKDRTPGSGAKFFVGCFQEAGQSIPGGNAKQTIMLTPWSKDIDKKRMQAVFSAELGGYDGTENLAVAKLLFVGGTGTNWVTLTGPTYLQRQGVTRVERRTKVVAIPPKTKQVVVWILGSRPGAGPCGFIDNVSLRVGIDPKAK
jgi:hypothetical protein